MIHYAVKGLETNGLKSPLLRQTWAASAIFLSVLSTGMLQQPATPEELFSHSDYSTSCLDYKTLATIIGSVSSSILMSQLGRRWAFILGTAPGMISCFVVNFADDSRMKLLRVTLNGLSTGFTVILGTIIIGEFTSPKYRGVFLNLLTTFMNIGNTIGLYLPPHHHWELRLTALFLQITSFGIAITWPESPYWLASKEQYEMSEKAFKWLRDTTCKKEITDLTTHRTEKFNHYSAFETTVGLLKKYTSSDFLRPVTVVIFGVILMESSGKHFLAVSSLYIEKTSGLDYFNYHMYTSELITLSSIVTMCLILILRHRTQLLTTGFLSALFLFFSSVYVFLKSNHFMFASITWLGPLLFLIQLVLSNLGSTSFPLALIGEVFPLDCKTVGSVMSGVIIYILPWAIIRSTPYLLSVAHLEGVLIIFGALMIVSLMVLLFIMPETKNKSLMQIHDFNNDYFIEDEINDGELTIEFYPRAGEIPLLQLR